MKTSNIFFKLILNLLRLFTPDSSKNTESCLSQPAEIKQKVGSDANIPCEVRKGCPGQPWKYEWFSFKENYHTHLQLREYPSKYSLKGASLHISSLQENDSGIYHCAAVSLGKPGHGMQQVGPGTTLIVTGEREKNPKSCGVDEGRGWRDTCLSAFVGFFFDRDVQNSEPCLSVGGIDLPVSLQPRTGDHYCKEGNSLKVTALIWFQAVNVFLYLQCNCRKIQHINKVCAEFLFLLSKK